MDTNAAVVGIDPGGRTTGVCARVADNVVFAELVTRTSPTTIADPEYLAEVVASITDAIATGRRKAAGVVIAVEGINPPTPHLGMASVTGLLGTAAVVGAVLSMWPDAVVVAPGGHGSGPLGAYPPVLRGPRETAGTGKRRHLRSAYDVAGTCLQQLVLPQAS